MRLLPRLAALSAALVLPVLAEAASVKVDYLITLEGLSLGNAALEGSFDDSRYDMRLNGQLTGLIGAFSGSARGGAAARGTVAGTRLVSSGFSASAKAGLGERTVQVGVANGNVTQVEINPPFEERPERVPLTEASLKGIIDPLSGMVGLAANPARFNEPANCNRTAPVFDGTQRFNVVTSYSDTRVVRRPGGYTGPVLVCHVRYVPIAGHRTDRESVKFMADNRDMSVWLAPVEGTRMLVPVRIAIRTMIGMSIVEAQTWSVGR